MRTISSSAAKLSLAVLTCLIPSATLLGQTVAQGWMGGAQSPSFPQPLVLAPTKTFFGQDQSQPQSLPGASPESVQPNPSTGQGTAPAAQPGATTDQPSTPPASDWLKEVQAGIAAVTPGRFENTKYKWYGFVRLDAIFDSAPIRTTDMFVTSAIPIPQGRGQNFVLTPRYTRIGFETSTPWKEMDWTINTKIEMDFFNGNTSGLFGSFPLRLRFAFIDFGPFRFGQAASLFMDYDVFPDVLDYEGPPGMVLMRQPIASYKWEPNNVFSVSVGVEQPYSDIMWDDGTGAGFVVNPGTGIISEAGASRNVQDVPDLTGNVRYKHDWGHVQAAGILRKLTFLPGVGEADNQLGYGVNLTGTFHPWAVACGCLPDTDRTPQQKSRFLGQYAVGRGINRYIQDVNGLGLDAVFEPVNGFDTLRSDGWFLCYEHFWTDTVVTNILYGETTTDLPAALPDNTYRGARYFAANVIWLPVERMGVGLEFLFGERENKNGATGEVNRVQAGIQYKF
jgi:hypothetical protein